MAKWIEIKDKFPEDDSIVVIEYKSGDYGALEYFDINKDWWTRNVKRYLDESEDNTPSFTLLDMRAAFKSGQINGFEKCSQGYSKEYFAIFMEREYNIKLPD